jgi:OMF family outer membrane factor
MTIYAVTAEAEQTQLRQQIAPAPTNTSAWSQAAKQPELRGEPAPAETSSAAPPAKTVTPAESIPTRASDTTYGASPDTAAKSDFKRYSQQIRNKPALNSLRTAQPLSTQGSELTRQLPPFPTKKIEIDQSPEQQEVIFDENAILLKRPELKALISIERDLSPLSLDAEFLQPVSLRDVLITAVNNNLDIAISRTTAEAQKFTYLSSLGQFLPTVRLGDQQLSAHGAVTLPTSASSFFSGGALASPGTSLLGSAASTRIKIHGPIIISQAGFQYYGYRGGKILFGALRAKHELNAARASFKATYSDSLLTAARDYYNLVLAEALLQIRIRAADTSEEQVRVNTQRFEEGLATNLDVLQARTQLSRDRQALVDQQTNRRIASVQLADFLNINLGGDLQPVDRLVRKLRLVSNQAKITDLLRLAIDNRPELKQYDELRRAAKAAIVINAAGLQPTFAFNGTIFGISPSWQHMAALYTIGFNLNWNLPGVGTVDAANVATAKVQARQAALQAQKELVTVMDQVRTSFLRSLDAERNIEETSTEVSSATEELRLARLRFQNGLGTNLDIITAQRDLTQAQIDKAQAIINFNISQVQLVRDLGVISVDAVSGGKLVGPSR